MDVLRTPIGKPLTVVSPLKNSPPDCFSSPSCVSLAQGISRSAERDEGFSPSTSQGALPLDPAALKGWRTFYVFAFEGLR